MMNLNLWLANFTVPRYCWKLSKGSVCTKPQKWVWYLWTCPTAKQTWIQGTLFYCPAHQGIEENELADSLAKIALKKAKHLQPNTQLSPSEIQQGNKMLSRSKWTRRWENPEHTRYENIVPSISHKKLTLRGILSKNTSRKGISKIARLKTGHFHA